MSPRAFTSAFKKHLSFFDRGGDGVITFYSALRGSLALGMNFIGSMVLGVGLPLLYGNTGPLSSQVTIADVNIERPQLQALGEVQGRDFTRAELLEAVKNDSWVNWMHIFQMWNLAADGKGKVSGSDVSLFQNGELLYALEKRRRDRSDVLPFVRGGPLSVAGHALVVKRLFGVEVYQDKKHL